MNPIPGTPAFRLLFCYKLASTFCQLYLINLISGNGSSSEPFLQLTTIAHFGALAAALRGVDALIDPVLQAVNPFRHLTQDTIRAIGADTEGLPAAGMTVTQTEGPTTTIKMDPAMAATPAPTNAAVLNKIESNTAATAASTATIAKDAGQTQPPAP